MIMRKPSNFVTFYKCTNTNPLCADTLVQCMPKYTSYHKAIDCTDKQECSKSKNFGVLYVINVFLRGFFVLFLFFVFFYQFLSF